MTGNSALKWLFLDLNSYFASVEQQERPELRGRPVAVVPMMTDHTCAIAASYEAKAYGVKTGTIIRDAKRMCPRLVCVAARHDVYVDYHYRIMDEVERHIPVSRVWSIDEAACELIGREREPENAMAIARAIKDGLRRSLGPMIRCSVGIAPNSFLAKVATDMQKPDGLVVLEPETMREKLFALKLTDLPGINVNMDRRLRAAGVSTVEQLWFLAPKQARRIWGGVQGERFWMWLRGMDAPPPETQRSSIGHSRVLDPALRTPEPARQMARRLTVKAASRLRREEFYATRLYFSARTTDGARWACEARLPPSQDNFAFLRALEEMWERMAADRRSGRFYASPLYKKLSVTMTGLCRRHEITPDLFDTASPSCQRIERRNESLSRAIDGLNRRYGAETVQLGVSPKTKAGYVGTKIAFSRVPDRAEFLE